MLEAGESLEKADLGTKTAVVGGSGLEPLTSAMSTQYSNQLS